MFESKVIKRIDKMLDDAIEGKFQESAYDETKLSRLESKWKHFLGTSSISKENIEKEKENIQILLTDISHQTKTPMTNIKMYSELLRENISKGFTMSNIEICDELIQQTEKLEFLIELLTKISRLETGIVTVMPEKNSIMNLIKNVIDDFQAKAIKNSIIIECSGEDVEAVFDMKWTKEALGNIVDNALKYSPNGSTIFVSVKKYEIYSVISVKDQGIGIREEEMNKIFQRFYRGEDVWEVDGVGVGLYLTREILVMEGGYIKVKSKLGEGAEFLIYLKNS